MNHEFSQIALLAVKEKPHLGYIRRNKDISA